MRGLVLAFVFLSVGCGPSFAERFQEIEIPRLKDRASFDLGCPKEQLQTQTLGGNLATQGVSGCDKRATYVQTSSGWVLNSEPNAGETAKAQPE
ncbi:MAG: hypothetical protein HOW73_42830 [Polyangiaceae bacterium]|nr:hypothetical protein [Polyangiaceae bacterium]